VKGGVKLNNEQRDLLERNWDHALQIAFSLAKEGTPREEVYDAAVDTAINTALHFKPGERSYGAYFAFCVKRALFRNYQARLKDQRYVGMVREIAGQCVTPQFDNVDMASKAMACLSPRQSQIMRLTFFEDMSESQVAATLGCTSTNVHQIKQTALKKIREAMQIVAPI